MIVRSLTLQNYKNISCAALSFDENINIITGGNAQGKTNLLESIWLFTGCRSFRGSKEREYIKFGEERFCADIEFSDSQRNQSSQFIVYAPQRARRERRITLNKVEIKSTRELFENFRCVLFTPDDIDIIKGAPEKRRSFIDLCVSQIDPKMMGFLRKFEIISAQRAAVLKNIRLGMADTLQLDIWDRQLCRAGSYISFYRHKYILQLSRICTERYSEITGGKEKLEIKYSSNIFPEDYIYPENAPDKEMISIYYNMLKNSIDDDINTSRTRFGAGRDEIVILSDGRRLRDFGSQGQKKSAALVLKLAQAEILSKKTGEKPVVLLDDVMGELDENRQRLVGRIIKDMQVFITTCNAGSIYSGSRGGGKIFYVESGNIKEIKTSAQKSGE